MPQPPLRPRPPLARWLFERDLTLREGAVFFDTTAETLRRATLPLDDPNLRAPYSALMRRIIALTGGEITPNDWYPESVAA
jgi:hypothetical protein